MVLGHPGWREMSKTPLAALQTRIGPAWPEDARSSSAKRRVAGWVARGCWDYFYDSYYRSFPHSPKKSTTKSSGWWCNNHLENHMCVYIYMYNIVLAGGWPAPLKNDGLRQSGWLCIPNKWKVMKFMYQTTNQWCFNSLLVGGATTILKNMSSSMGRIIPYIMENKKCWKPPTSLCCWWTPSFLHTFYKVVR